MTLKLGPTAARTAELARDIALTLYEGRPEEQARFQRALYRAVMSDSLMEREAAVAEIEAVRRRVFGGGR